MSNRHYSIKSFVIAGLIVIAALIACMMISSFNLIQSTMDENYNFYLFLLAVLAVYGAGQYFIFRFIDITGKEIRRRSLFMNAIFKLVIISQFILAAIFATVLLQMALISHYDIYLITSALLLSSLASCFIMTFFSYRFFLWYKLTEDKNLIIFFYGFASAIVAFLMGTNIITYNDILAKLPEEIGPGLGIQPEAQTRAGSIDIIYKYINFIPNTLFFIITWSGSALLLSKYSKRIGLYKFWIIMLIPLILYLVGKSPSLITLSDDMHIFREKGLFFFKILFKSIAASGSIVFGIAFITIARDVHGPSDKINAVKNYLMISAFGIIMISICLISPILQWPYPPFGIAAHSFMVMAAYLFGLGLYSSAISVSHDAQLRQSIRYSVEQYAQLLHSIATADMTQDLQNKVLRIAKDKSNSMEEQTGISPSITDDEMKQYTEMIIDERKTIKNSRDNVDNA